MGDCNHLATRVFVSKLSDTGWCGDHRIYSQMMTGDQGQQISYMTLNWVVQKHTTMCAWVG